MAMKGDGGFGAVRAAIMSVAIVLAGCSRMDALPPGAPLVEAVQDAPAGPIPPDFDATKNAFYRECMQGQHDVKECTCTTQALKDGAGEDTYQAMFASGMSAVIPLKGAASDAVNTALKKALKECRGK
jgi:hypothetical protein